MKINKIINAAISQIKSSKIAATLSNISPKKAQASALECLGNYNKMHVLSGGDTLSSAQRLQKYTVKNYKPVAHMRFYNKFKDVFTKQVAFQDIWMQCVTPDISKCAWKIHLYSTDEDDWQRLTACVGPYLTENKINWKTISPFSSIDELANTHQNGKAITIYPHTNDEFKQLAKDLSQIIKQNQLSKLDTYIHGDRALGDTGRIFYRYEYNSGKYKDTILDPLTYEGGKLYERIYDSARPDGRYLAFDMTEADDPWIKLDL